MLAMVLIVLAMLAVAFDLVVRLSVAALAVPIVVSAFITVPVMSHLPPSFLP